MLISVKGGTARKLEGGAGVSLRSAMHLLKCHGRRERISLMLLSEKTVLRMEGCLEKLLRMEETTSGQAP